MEYGETPDKVEIKKYSFYKEATEMAATKTMIRIRLKAYDHKILDESAKLIVDVLARDNASFADPAPYREGDRYDSAFTPRKQGFP